MAPQQLRAQLGGLFPGRFVTLAYLFGSHASGREHSESDVDIAVLFDTSLDAEARFARRLALIGDLSRLLRSDAVDVVVLNDAPPLLAHNVLRHGVLLHSADEAVRIEFQVRTLRDLEDSAPLRRRLEKALEARLEAGTFGVPTLTTKGRGV